MRLLPILERFFRDTAPLGPGDRVVVAFSGGPDSTALLAGLAELAPRLGAEVVAAHLDHGLDPGSTGRAEAARRLAGQLAVPVVVERRPVAVLSRKSESVEAAARRVRYEFLDEVRRGRGARWVATAHHRDDQAETVVLRLLFGSGLAGLAGIRPVDGAVVRPLLGCGRDELRAALAAGAAFAESGLEPVADPTNDDLAVPRNRVRHRLLPALARLEATPAEAGSDDLDADSDFDPDFDPGFDPGFDPDERLARQLARLADRARGAGRALERRLEARFAPEPGASLGRGALEQLPEPLLAWALAALHRRAGAPYPAGSAARAELLRQLARGARVGCDCGGGWHWRTSTGPGDRDERVELARVRAAARGFSYTLQVPGEVAVPEISARIRLRQTAVEPWMFRGAAHRAALVLPLQAGGGVTVRNRRPGDRVVPLGAPGSRRLKDLLIDRRVPREERDRLPLLCVDGRIAWVPGVTIDQRFRLTEESAAAVWVAEVVPA
jgi:tRNA(Ile)-lysidine synthase